MVCPPSLARSANSPYERYVSPFVAAKSQMCPEDGVSPGPRTDALCPPYCGGQRFSLKSVAYAEFDQECPSTDTSASQYMLSSSTYSSAILCWFGVTFRPKIHSRGSPLPCGKSPST